MAFEFVTSLLKKTSYSKQFLCWDGPSYC